MWLRLASLLLGAALCAQGGHQLELSGHVFNSVTEQPVAGALVVLEYVPSEASPGRPSGQPVVDRQLTDQSGRFSFTRSPGAGTHLRALREGYQESTYIEGLEDDFEPAGSRNVRIRLIPLSVIHGRVRNSDGEPIPDVQVQAIRLSVESGRRKTTDFGSSVTDDHGEYRLFHLPGGSYYVKAGGRTAALVSLTSLARLGESDETYPALYYPGAAGQNSASEIRLGAGEAFQADFELVSRPAYRIRGQVKGATEYVQPTIRLLRDGGNLASDAMASRVQYHLTDGSFELSDVAPGAYVLEASMSDRGMPLRDQADVIVSNRDVTGVALSLGPPLEVHGTVEFTGTNAPPTTDSIPSPPRRIVVGARSRSTAATPHAAGDSASDGHFTLRMFPGTYDVDVALGGYYVASIQAGGVDVLADGLVVGPSGAPDLKVVISPGGGTLEGVVKDLPESPTAAASVLVVRKHGSAIIPQVTMAWQGRFKMQNLAPGEYTVYAWIPPRDVEYYNPQALQQISSNAVTVYVSDGETQQVSVKLAPKEQP
jgi:hypothetical protein